MPVIPVDFSGVEEFADLPEGTYEGTIEKLTYKEAKAAGKFPGISVGLVTTGGEQDGQRAWQNLSFSPKALFRMKRFFDLFGLSDDLALEVDDETSLVTNPALDGEPVVFTIAQNGTYGTMPDGVTPRPSFQAEVIEWLGGNQQQGTTAPAGKAPTKAEPVRAGARRALR